MVTTAEVCRSGRSLRASAVLDADQTGESRDVCGSVAPEVDRRVVVVPLDARAGEAAPDGAAGADVDGGEVPRIHLVRLRQLRLGVRVEQPVAKRRLRNRA